MLWTIKLNLKLIEKTIFGNQQVSLFIKQIALSAYQGSNEAKKNNVFLRKKNW